MAKKENKTENESIVDIFITIAATIIIVILSFLFYYYALKAQSVRSSTALLSGNEINRHR